MQHFWAKQWKNGNVAFWLCLAILYVLFGIIAQLNKDPHGIHFIRQTDSLSFASYYYHHGFDFFHPGTFNLMSTDGRAACEFPVLYYLTALLYLIFGENDIVLRVLTLSLSSVGFFALFKWLKLMLAHVWLALIVCFWFCSSTVLLYYSVSYLPDAAALALTLIGLYLFYPTIQQGEAQGRFKLALYCFILAALLKITYAIYPIAAIATLLSLQIKSGYSLKALLLRNKPIWFAALSGICLLLAWNLYATLYNAGAHNTYFLMQARPIWSLDATQRHEVWHAVSHDWLSHYYYVSSIHVFAVLALIGFLFVRKLSTGVGLLTLFALLGVSAYVLLFFAQFRDHDYYALVLLPALVIAVSQGILRLREWRRAFSWHVGLTFMITLFSLLSLNYGREKLAGRFALQEDDYFDWVYPSLKAVKPLLDQLDPDQQQRVILIGDRSVNGGLYALKRMGWVLPQAAPDSYGPVIEKLRVENACYVIAPDSLGISVPPAYQSLFVKNGWRVYGLK